MVLKESTPDDPVMNGKTVPPISLNECDCDPQMKQQPFNLPDNFSMCIEGEMIFTPSRSNEEPGFNLVSAKNFSNRS